MSKLANRNKLAFSILFCLLYNLIVCQEPANKILESKQAINSYKVKNVVVNQNLQKSVAISKASSAKIDDNALKKIIATTTKNYNVDKAVFKGAEVIGDLLQTPLAASPLYGAIHKQINSTIFKKGNEELQKKHQEILRQSLQELREKNQEDYQKIVNSGRKEDMLAYLSDSYKKLYSILNHATLETSTSASNFGSL